MAAHQIELILVLLLAALTLVTIADRIRIPYPMVLLIGGMVLAVAPGLPQIDLEPDLVFLLFLPPILFYAAYFTSWRDFRRNLRPIGLLAFGCVLMTTIAVAIVAKLFMPDMPWAVGFVIGAIVSPPDAVAATAIFQRLGAPSQVVTILEGESLVNDASALIAYRFAVAAVVGGSFSMVEASEEFLLLGVGGIALGLACGWLITRVTPYLPDSSVMTAFTLMMPAVIYVVAERIELSGVLAVVAAGLYYGRSSSRAMTAAARVRSRAVWDTVILVINSLVFILIGLQLPHVVDGIVDVSIATLIWRTAVISATVIVARFVWVFAVEYLPKWVLGREGDLGFSSTFIIAWSGLRGVVSLASALALPIVTDSGADFPYRNDVIFITFGVIVVTLFGQGAMIPLLLRRLGVTSDGSLEREERKAHAIAAKAALGYLDQVRDETWVPGDHHERLHHRFSHVMELKQMLPEDAREHMEQSDRLHHEVLVAAQQARVIAARSVTRRACVSRRNSIWRTWRGSAD